MCPRLYLHPQVTTDNGGGPWDSNTPLRGTKETLFEGGIRGAAFVHSPLLGRRGEWRGMMHLVDWVPTLLGAAGITPPPGLDGRDLWQAIRSHQWKARKIDKQRYNAVLLQKDDPDGV